MMNKKLAVVILTIITCNTLIAQSIKKLQNDTIIWRPDYEVSFEDFKKKAPARVGIDGLTTTGIIIHLKEENGELIFYIEAIMVKSKSYIKDSSEYILNHERRHFDIVELWARKFRKKILSVNFAKVKNINAEINKIFESINNDLRKQQEKYDEETQHGMNMVKQKLWNERIKVELAELDAYASTAVNIVR